MDKLQFLVLITHRSHQRANAIVRCFVTRDSALLVRAFVCCVRPLLECSSLVWSSYLKCDIETIEKVQKRYTKKLVGPKALPYAQAKREL